MARLMRGALMLTAARTPYRRAGLAFPAGVPLTIAVLALTALQLRRLLEDASISVLVGTDDRGFVLQPELNASLSDAELLAFIDAAPPVEIEAFPAEASGPEEEVASLRVQLDDVRAALAASNGVVLVLQDEARVGVAALASAQLEVERLREVDTAWHADQRHLHDQGFQSLEALTSAWAVDRSAANAKDARIAELVGALEISDGDVVRRDARITELLAAASEDADRIIGFIGEVQTRDARIAELETALADATKPATGKAKPKPAD